jgi:hypothetical protein
MWLPSDAHLMDTFEPTWRRLTLAVGLAAIGFIVPQGVPLIYYPLNNPSEGLQYLEVTCSSSENGEVQVILDTGRGFDELDSIRWPVSPGDEDCTYTFPLPDAPLFGLRVMPLRSPGELMISKIQIINRRRDVIYRLYQGDFRPDHQIRAIVSSKSGWKIVATPNSTDPYVTAGFRHPIVPLGMNARNLERCLLSWSYLTLMLWILLLACYFSLRRHQNGRVTLQTCAFLAVIALLFSLVGNRGLVKESIRCGVLASSLGASEINAQ